MCMQVLSATSELYPLIKTGGLADVTGALPKALGSHGVETRSILPAYPGLLDSLSGTVQEAEAALLGEPARIYSGRRDGLEIILLECPSLFDREGGPYLDPDGVDH